MRSLLAPLLQLALEAGDAIMEVYRSDDFQTRHKADASPLTLADRRAHEIIVAGLPSIAPGVPILSEEGAHAPYAERAGWRELWLVDPLDGTKEFVKRNGEFTVNIALVRDGEPLLGVIYAPDRRTAWLGIAPGPADTGAWKLDPDEVAGFREGKIDPESPATAISVRTRDPRRIAVIASRTHLNESTRAYIDHVTEPFDEVEIINVGSSLKLCTVADGRADLYPRFAPTSEWDTAAGHAIVRAAGGEIHQTGPDADRDGAPLRYNKEDLLNPWFIVRAWEQG